MYRQFEICALQSFVFPGLMLTQRPRSLSWSFRSFFNEFSTTRIYLHGQNTPWEVDGAWVQMLGFKMMR